VVICDISTSMRHCSELMLSLVYALQDLVTKTHAFAFIDHLEYISPDFVGKEPTQPSPPCWCVCRPATTAPIWATRWTTSPNYLDTIDQPAPRS
jgi:hypothetical protein